MRESNEKILRELIARHSNGKIRPADIVGDRDFMKDLGFTSINAISLIVDIEEALNVEVSNDYYNLANINTLDKLCDMLAELSGAEKES